MKEKEVIELAKSAWNAQTDEFNQWAAIGEDEKMELVARAVISAAHAAASDAPTKAWLTAEGDRVVTDWTKRTIPRAAQAPYTVALIRPSGFDAARCDVSSDDAAIPVQEIIEAAKVAWNDEGNRSNRWSELECDEKLQRVARAGVAFAAAAAGPTLAWLTAEGDRVITDATKRSLPRAAQAPYTEPLVRAPSGQKEQL